MIVVGGQFLDLNLALPGHLFMSLAFGTWSDLKFKIIQQSGEILILAENILKVATNYESN